MDGDSATTDASQLGISADYIGGSHYVIQPHDGRKATTKTLTGRSNLVEIVLPSHSRLLGSLREN